MGERSATHDHPSDGQCFAQPSYTRLRFHCGGSRKREACMFQGSLSTCILPLPIRATSRVNSMKSPTCMSAWLCPIVYPITRADFCHSVVTRSIINGSKWSAGAEFKPVSDTTRKCAFSALNRCHVRRASLFSFAVNGRSLPSSARRPGGQIQDTARGGSLHVRKPSRPATGYCVPVTSMMLYGRSPSWSTTARKNAYSADE